MPCQAISLNGPGGPLKKTAPTLGSWISKGDSASRIRAAPDTWFLSGLPGSRLPGKDPRREPRAVLDNAANVVQARGSAGFSGRSAEVPDTQYQDKGIEMSDQSTRRRFLQRSVMTGAVFALPSFVPSHVLGKDGATSPSETIPLGVIGIGPRCTYDLTAMLGLSDVRCIAIADVQASRRDAGKRLVDGHYGNTDCTLVATSGNCLTARTSTQC